MRRRLGGRGAGGTALVLLAATGLLAAPATSTAAAPVPEIGSGFSVPVPLLLCGPAWELAPGEPAASERVAGAPPAYYAIALVPTGRVPGTRLSKGIAESRFAASPFGVSLAPGGEYVHELIIATRGLRPREGREYVVWLSTPELDQIERIGPLDDSYQARGEVAWNKFLVIITLEQAGVDGDIWQGPVIMRGMSRSGRMHTMAGHGAFMAEPCAKYGYQ